MTGARRYLRLMGAFARYCLANELAFRGNFIAKIILEVLWLGILLVFYDTIFANTKVVAGWDKSQYLVFVGCYYTLEGIIETFFLENCSEFSELIRTGELDFFLLKPIDEQFLITCRKTPRNARIEPQGHLVGKRSPSCNTIPARFRKNL